MIKKYKYQIKNIIKSIFTYLALLIYFNILFTEKTYNFLLTLLFFILIFFYQHGSKILINRNIEIRKLSTWGSILISIILTIGSMVYTHISIKDMTIFTGKHILYTIIGTIGFYYFFEIITTYIFNNLPNIKTNKESLTKKHLLIIFIVIFICWLPYFLRYFPAVMTNDSYYSLYYIEHGILNDHHTFGHTWFVGLIYLFGKLIFHNMNQAVAFYTIIQMLICDYVFVYIVKFLNELKIKKIYLYVVSIIFAISPLFAIYSITIWRDVLFGMAFPILFITIYKYIKNDYKISYNLVIPYFISVLFILFMRNNGIYILILFTPFLVLLSKYNKKVLAITNIMIIIIYFIIKGPIFTYFGVEKSKTTEALSIPIQQIARVITMDKELDNESYSYLSSIMDIKEVKELYNPTISDKVKEKINNNLLSETKGEFFRTWLKLLVRYPRTYVEAYFCQTLGYWYPDVIYWATARDSKSIFDDVDVYTDSKLPNMNIIDSTTSRRIPLSNMIWSIGLMFITLLFSTFILIYQKRSKYLLCYIPIYALWMSLMLATPVFSELRYIYGLFTCMPLIIAISLVDERTKA